MYIKGIARVDRKTKDLVKRLQPGDIAVINHDDIDEVAAHALVAGRIVAVVNAGCSISGYYPNSGPLTLIKSGVFLLDNVGEKIMDLIKEGQVIEILDNAIYHNGSLLATGEILEAKNVEEKMALASSNINKVLFKFIENTLEHARREIGLVAGEYVIPLINTSFQGKHALIVVRGKNYIDDLKAIRSYIDEVNPVLVGVDGGADALLEFGYSPDLIVGDMDSVSDAALLAGAELVVHAYTDGRAPGMARVERLGLTAKVFSAPGTSEDIAMLLAYEKGAELIVAVGTHSSMEDFLEKGRKGMASTFLVRMKVGSILVDAKGVSKLYRNRIKARYLAQIILAALLPAGVIVLISPVTREWLRLLYLQFKLFLGI